MPTKTKIRKNPFTGATRTTTKTTDSEGKKTKYVSTSSGKKKFKKNGVKRKNTKEQKKSINVKLKKGGKIRNMFTEQYD
jgi:hypothetical protein|tara:strand:+ start:759 stop:995 length:237 start_codon:yes stop_codon:yes gene_type:complete